MTTLTITIVTRDRLPLTKTCLASLMPTIAGKDVTVCIVDNGSTDGSVEYLRSFVRDYPQIRLILLPRNMGVSVGANLGWASFPAEYYMKLDNDIEIREPGWLDRLLDFSRANNDTAMVGYRYFERHEMHPVRLAGDETFWASVCCNGGVALVPRRISAVCGYWCEDYGVYGHTDVDYSNRAKLGGFHVGYLANDNTIAHLGYERDIDVKLEALKFAVRTREETGRKLYLLNKFLYEEGVRGIYVDRRFLPDFSGDTVRFSVNPAYVGIIKLQTYLLERVSYALEGGDVVSLNLSELKTALAGFAAGKE